MLIRTSFSEQLIIWYTQHQRDLPWRHTQNPYYIWLSEVILQQTRIAQGLPFYERFVETFPTIEALANADQKEVLRLWQGLGYYSRARNLHQTAKIVVQEYGGVFPNTYTELLKLKGIGTYTAAAIASFAFGEKVAVLDGNVYRVLSRVFGIETDITSNEAKKVFGKLANELISDSQPATHNQAIMEFGAVQCVPVSPLCLFCPLSFGCVANAANRQGSLPVKTKKTKVRERFFNYFVIEQNQRLLLRERTNKDVWEGMFDFYLIETHQAENWETLVEDAWLKTVAKLGTMQSESGLYTHILTHQRIQTKFWHISLSSEVSLLLPSNFQFYVLEEVDQLPKSTLVNNFLKEYFF